MDLATEVEEEKNEGVDDRVNILIPLLIPTVIRCVLKYLSLTEIKKFRCVSLEWNEVVELMLRSRSLIKLSNDEKDLTADGTKFHPSKFLEIFSSTLKTIPFTAFKIHQAYDWSIKDLTDFFLSQKENIRVLVIKDIGYVSEDGRELSFDVTPWIENSPMTKENTKYITKLSTDHSTSRIIIGSTVLTNIKELLLSSCSQINLQDQIKFRPVTLKFVLVKFFREGQILSELCINDIVDFGRAKDVYLQCVNTYEKEELEDGYVNNNGSVKRTQLYLNLSGNLSLDRLVLMGVRLINWKTCTWTVNTLMMRQSFTQETEMKIQELNFSKCKLDLAVLPKSLKTLNIKWVREVICSCNSQIILENLHHLTLSRLSPYQYQRRQSSLTVEYYSIVLKSVKCPNLVSLSVEGDYKLNSKLIPKSVKRLSLVAVKIIGIEERKNFSLEKLVLKDYSLRDVKEICSAIGEVKELVLLTSWHKEQGNSNNIRLFLGYLRLKISFGYNMQRIHIGPIKWADQEFKNSRVMDYVDKEAEYYVFENQKGKGLDLDWFQIGRIEDIHNVYK